MLITYFNLIYYILSARIMITRQNQFLITVTTGKIMLTISRIPVFDVKYRGCSSAGRALEWHSRGRGFDPPRLHITLLD
jgi:hypothetical protein